MSRHQAKFASQVLLCVDVLVCALTMFAALKIRGQLDLYPIRNTMANWLPASWNPVLNLFPSEIAPLGPVEFYPLLIVAMIPLWAVILYRARTSDFRSSYQTSALRYASVVGIGLLLLVSILFITKTESRGFVVLFGVVQFLGLLVTRIFIMESIAFLRNKHVDGHRVLIVGCSKHATALSQAMRKQSPWNMRIVGHVSVDGETIDDNVGQIIGNLNQLEELLDEQPIDEVVFAVLGQQQESLTNALRACDDRGVDVLLTLPKSFPAAGQMEVAQIDGLAMPLLGVRRTPTGGIELFAKRMLDLVGVAAVLLVSAPVMLLVALAIRLESPGAVIFKQERVGRNGRKFVMYKFRSMVVDAEARRKSLEHLNEMSGPVFKITHDPRITKVGAFIRRTSLDELPQLFNVLLGDMSLVGPRPPLPSEVCKYEAWQRRRLSVTPGLTGLWQVSGRNNIDFEEWMHLDLRYIDSWSIWLDFKILLRTVPVVLKRSGAS